MKNNTHKKRVYFYYFSKRRRKINTQKHSICFDNFGKSYSKFDSFFSRTSNLDSISFFFFSYSLSFLVFSLFSFFSFSFFFFSLSHISSSFFHLCFQQNRSSSKFSLPTITLSPFFFLFSLSLFFLSLFFLSSLPRNNFSHSKPHKKSLSLPRSLFFSPPLSLSPSLFFSPPQKILCMARRLDGSVNSVTKRCHEKYCGNCTRFRGNFFFCFYGESCSFVLCWFGDGRRERE